MHNACGIKMTVYFILIFARDVMKVMETICCVRQECNWTLAQSSTPISLKLFYMQNATDKRGGVEDAAAFSGLR